MDWGEWDTLLGSAELKAEVEFCGAEVMAYIVMALYSYGPILLWPYIVMALYSDGPIQLWPHG